MKSCIIPFAELNFVNHPMANKKKTYSLSQILLHWLTALFVAYQFVANDEIKKTYQIFFETGEWPSKLTEKTTIHVILGILILVMMFVRLYLRLKTKTPSLPEKMPTPMKLLAKSSHYLLYFFLLLMPITGLLGWFVELKFAIRIHTYSSSILLTLILFHICATIFHEGVLGNKIIQRMLHPEAKN